METIRETQVFSRAVTSADVKYQASPFYPGYLERINEDGSRDVGLFKEGEFKVARVIYSDSLCACSIVF